MSEAWFHFNSGACNAAANMAIDEAFLDLSQKLSRPVLRFYSWTQSAATFGYFQRYADVQGWTDLRPLIRRPTGGGLVPHNADWTYSLIFPPTHEWHRFKAVESYRRLHDWICRAFRSLGVATELAASAFKEMPGCCFVGAEQFDLLLSGKKIAGAAQRRNRQGLLIQGSIQPIGLSFARMQWERAMLQCVSWPCGVEWVPLEFGADLRLRAMELELNKYAQTSYNERR